MYAQNDSDQQLTALRQEATRNKERVIELEQHLKHTQDTAESQLVLAQSEVEASKKALALAQQQAQESSTYAASIQIKLNKANDKCLQYEEQLQNIHACSSNPSRDKENGGALSRQLHSMWFSVLLTVVEQIDLTKELESKLRAALSENKFLKRNKENVEAVREQVSLYKNKLVDADKYKERYDTLVQAHALLQKEKAEWSAFLDQQDMGDRSMSTPNRVSKTLATERINVRLLTDRVGALSSDLKEKQMEVEQLEVRIGELETTMRMLEKERRRDALFIRRLERSKHLLQQEVNFLRQQLESYDMEELANKTADMSMEMDSEPPYMQRMRELESMVETYRQQMDEWIHTTQTELHPVVEIVRHESQSGTKHMERIQALENELESVRRDKAMQEKEIKSLESQLVAVEYALGRGEYDRTTTRILQLTDNPAAQARIIREQDMHNLRAENKQLLAQLASRPASSDSTDTETTVPLTSYNNLMAETTALQEQLAHAEKRNLRFKEVFQAKAQEYREAVYSLLGYKIDFLANGRVRVTSAYAPSADCSFVFTSQDNDEGTMELVSGGNDAWTNSLSPWIHEWVVEKECIPGLLAEVTRMLVLEAWEAGTLQMGRQVEMDVDDAV